MGASVDCSPRGTERSRHDLAQIEDIITNYLGIYNMDDRPVCITQPSSHNHATKQDIMEYMFETLQVPFLDMPHQNTLACHNLNINSALVVRIANQFATEITPVYDYSSIQSHYNI